MNRGRETVKGGGGEGGERKNNLKQELSERGYTLI